LHEAIDMVKMTKTQKKNALRAIRVKAFRLVIVDCMSAADYGAIERITNKYQKKLK